MRQPWWLTSLPLTATQDAISVAVHKARIKAIEWGIGGPVESPLTSTPSCDAEQMHAEPQAREGGEGDEGDDEVVIKF